MGFVHKKTIIYAKTLDHNNLQWIGDDDQHQAHQKHYTVYGT